MSQMLYAGQSDREIWNLKSGTFWSLKTSWSFNKEMGLEGTFFVYCVPRIFVDTLSLQPSHLPLSRTQQWAPLNTQQPGCDAAAGDLCPQYRMAPQLSAICGLRWRGFCWRLIGQRNQFIIYTSSDPVCRVCSDKELRSKLQVSSRFENVQH